MCHRGLFLSWFPFVCSASPVLLKSLSSFHNKLTCSANFHFSSVTPTAAPPHQCNCFRLFAHLYAPSLCSPSDCLCFHAGSTDLFLDWYQPKLPLTFRLWPSNTASLLSLSACGSVALRLFLLNSDSCLKVRILTQLWREPLLSQWGTWTPIVRWASRETLDWYLLPHDVCLEHRHPEQKKTCLNKGSTKIKCQIPELIFLTSSNGKVFRII